ncbi:hypothetical protein NPIL_440561, partial [Nephila pilipes]
MHGVYRLRVFALDSGTRDRSKKRSDGLGGRPTLPGGIPPLPIRPPR